MVGALCAGFSEWDRRMTSVSAYSEIEAAVCDVLLDRLLDEGDVLPAHVESVIRLDRDNIIGCVSVDQSEFFIRKRGGNILCAVCKDHFLPHVHHIITNTNNSFVLYTTQVMFDLHNDVVFDPYSDIMKYG